MQDGARAFGKLEPGIGQHHPAPLTQEKIEAKLKLKIPYLSRHGRLGDVKPLGGVADPAMFGNSDEIAKVTQFQLYNSQALRSVIYSIGKYQLTATF